MAKVHYWHKGATARWKQDILLWFVWRLPRIVVYWAAIRLISAATVGKYADTVVPELKAMDALERWEGGNE